MNYFLTFQFKRQQLVLKGLGVNTKSTNRFLLEYFSLQLLTSEAFQNGLQTQTLLQNYFY